MDHDDVDLKWKKTHNWIEPTTDKRKGKKSFMALEFNWTIKSVDAGDNGPMGHLKGILGGLMEQEWAY